MTKDGDYAVPIVVPAIGQRERERVDKLLDAGTLGTGETVAAFERAFATTCHVDHAVATANGTTAVHAALHASGIGDGDTVITSPLAPVGTADAIHRCGGHVRFADVDSETYTLDPASVREIIDRRDERVHAILPVHRFGLAAPIEPLSTLASEFDAVLVADARGAVGATYDGDPVGSLCNATAFSFSPGGNVTTGAGGMVVTDDDQVAARAEAFVNQGHHRDGTRVEVGHDFRMTNLEAAIGRVQLKRLSRFVRARRDNAAVLTDALDGTPLSPPKVPMRAEHGFNSYAVRAPERARFVEHLATRGVETATPPGTMLHELAPYDEMEPSVPVAERLWSELLTLPVHPHVTESDRSTMVEAISLYEVH